MTLAVSALTGLAALAPLWLWILSRARRSERAAETAFPPLGQFLDVEGHRVHVRVMGDGPDLVLLHGSGGNLRDFTLDLAPRLARQYRVILLDRPGHGYTDPVSESGATLREQAALMAKAARQLGARKPLVLGHSYGGAVALAWAVHAPERLSGLIALSAPSYPWEGGLPALYRVTSHRMLSWIVNPVLTAFVSEARVERAVACVFAPNAMPEGYLAQFGAALSLRRDALRANARQRRNLLTEISALVPLYGRIDVPTEIVHGTIDTTVSLSIHSEPLARQIPGARLTPLDGIAHMPQHAAPEAVIAAIHRVAARAGLHPER